MKRVTGIALALVLSSATARADVITVGPSGSDFAQIKAAVQSAADGDVIHVETGTYDNFRVDDKALRIVNTSTGVVSVSGVIRIHDLSLGKTLVLSGIDADASGAEGLIVFQSQGSVRVQDGEFKGGPGDGGADYHNGYAGAKVEGSSDVVFTRCFLEGGHGGHGCWDCFIGTTSAGPGLRAEDARVALLSSMTQGGNGGSSDENDIGGAGGDGVNAEGSHVFIARTVLRGGSGGGGGDGDSFNKAGNGGRGGSGVQVRHARAWLLDNQYFPSSGGSGGCCGLYGDGADGADGRDVLLAFMSEATELSGRASALEGPGVALEGTSVDLTVHGKPGDEVYLASSIETGFAIRVPQKGVWLLGDDVLPTMRRTATGSPGGFAWPTRGDSLGTIGASGTLTLNHPIGDLPPGVPAAALYLQGMLVRASGRVALTDLLIIEVTD